MDRTKESIKLARLSCSLDEVRAKIHRRREELRAEELEQRRKDFDKLPATERRIREMFGWSPYQTGEPIRRFGSAFEVKK